MPPDAELFICAGELSGDLLAGSLAKEIRVLRPNWHLCGIGGPHLAAAGANLMYDSHGWGAIGVTQAVRLIPRLSFALAAVKRHLAHKQPDLTVLVDFGTFNVRVARFAKRHGLKVCYYVPPGSWRRERANPELARITDLVITPFPWSAASLRSMGANAHWVGHPLLDLVKPSRSRHQLLQDAGLPPDATIIALVPGSRPSELAGLATRMAQAALLIQKRLDGCAFLVAASPTANVAILSKYLTQAGWQSIGGNGCRFAAGGRPAAILKGQTYNVMAASNLLLCCSGTATLEAAILGKPMVIAYRIAGAAANIEYALGKRGLPRWVGLPNLLAGEEVYPELIQNDATPERLADAAMDVIRSGNTGREGALARIRECLGEPGASARAAQLICSPDLGRGRLA